MTLSRDWDDALGEDLILVTGAAGFIGYHLADRLLQAGKPVLGIDNFNAYYDPALKEARLARLEGRPGFSFVRLDLADREGIAKLFAERKPRYVVNLGAQAGVRYSIDNPHAYAESNLLGFLNILEGCRRAEVAHLVYASSSSVYGGNRRLPFSVHDATDHPVSLYAATKRANEMMAHSYSHLYALPATGLRFFTVYGPWGRPDMAYWKFTEAIFAGRPISVYNNGEMERDFTYIDDIVEGVLRVIPAIAAPAAQFDVMAPDPAISWAPHRLYNIGNSCKESLMDMIAILERAAGREAIKRFEPMQPGDVQATWADMRDLEEAVGFRPDTSLREGLGRFVSWYRDFHRV